MKKFLAVCLTLIAVYFLVDYLYYGAGVFIPKNEATTTAVTVSDKKIFMTKDGKDTEFEIKGVDMGVGIPGHFATDFAISKETYLRWFKYIQEMGANTVRVYTVLHSDFYQAVYEYNVNNPNPLYIIQGLWVNDYIQNSHRDGYDSKFIDTFIDDAKTIVDIIHGKKKFYLGKGIASGSYNKDVSPWVIGYILGVEWEDVTVAYTDKMNLDKSSYSGTYMYTTPQATPFEALLARVGDEIIRYETLRYHQQRLVAFSNWPITDPFDYPDDIANYFYKIAKVDVEHIKTTDQFISGSFASYHIYPYFPDYLNYYDDKSAFVDENKKVNTYYSYLKMINDHHTIPVIISEFGIPTSRGMAQKDYNTGRNQGGMSETQQGKALVDCYNDIKKAGCAGSIVFTWQDEWFKRTWNTMHSVDLLKTPYWSDYQTNEQYFGLLSFDPGKDKSISYMDGDISEWTDKDIRFSDKDASISVKYDEKFIYILANKKGFGKTQKLYLPVDITPKSGGLKCDNYNLEFDRPADFVIAIDGKENSKIIVQERYEVLRAMFYQDTHGKDPYETPPATDTTVFKPINMILQTATELVNKNGLNSKNANSEVYETGRLTYGNANPTAANYNSMADFHFNGDYVEIKIPWQIFNFSNPSEMKIHDDYYLNYGIEDIKIKEMYIGIGTGDEKINMASVPLKGWGNKITYHERLKPAYYEMQKLWGGKAVTDK